MSQPTPLLSSTEPGPDPIPVALFGKDEKIARVICDKLRPDIEVVHVCLTLSTALAEFPTLFNSSPALPPSSGLGTNARLDTNPNPDPTTTTTISSSSSSETDHGQDQQTKRSSRRPRAVFFGGKFSDGEHDAIVSAVRQACERLDGALAVDFVKVQRRDVLAAGSFGPNADVIARLFRKKMAAALEREKLGRIQK